MRFRVPALMLLFTVCSLALPLAAHAEIPFFGPIIDGKILNQTCPLGWGAVMTVINNIISLLLTIAILFVAPIMIAYSGFLFVVNPVNASGKEEAKKILTNTVVGIVIALAGWMIVAAIMAVLYNPSAQSESGKTKLEVWSNLIGSKGIEPCLKQEGTLPGQSFKSAVVAPSVKVVPVIPPVGLESITAFGCKNASSCQVSAATIAKLDQMKTDLGATASQYQITETGVNTTVAHASGADNLDMSCYGPCSPVQVKAAIAAWPGSVKYETANQSDYDAMIAAGVPTMNILGPTWFTGTFNINNGICSTGTGHCITAPHMSLKP